VKGHVALSCIVGADVTLDRDDIEAIVTAVVEALREEAPERAGSPPARFVDAAAVAAELGVDRDWVYANAEALGAIRLGGPRGRLRFDLAVLPERLAALAEPRRPGARQRPRSKRPTPAPAAPLIPYRPQHFHDGRAEVA
jgi:hypothetical protein